MVTTKKENTNLKVQDESTLADIIHKAMDKVKAKKENELCTYIPYSNGRLHHFTYKLMKAKDPKTVANLIKENILDKKPKRFARNYKPRKSKITTPIPTDNNQKEPLSSRHERFMKETTKALELLNHQVNALENKSSQKSAQQKLDFLTPNVSDRFLRTIQNQLVKKIRAREIDYELWDTFVDLVQSN